MVADRDPGARLTPQAVLGVTVIVFGLALLAGNLGLIAIDDAWRYFPLVFVFVGIAKLLRPGASNRIGGALLVFIGAWWTADLFYILPFHVWDWWPLLLIAFGVLMITRGLGRSSGGVAVGDSRLSEFAFWSGIKRRVTSSAFQHADLTAVMGGIEFDLRGAGTGGGEAVIDVFAMWGGIEIKVPPDWTVSNRVTAILGGADDRSTGSAGSTHHLVVRGFVMMGGVEIKT
jgi:predicted membrane protein